MAGSVYDIEGELRINYEFLGPYASMGIKQTLGQIDGDGFRRDWNFVAIGNSPNGSRLFKTTISGADVLPPIVQTLWRDDSALVECVAELCAGRGLVDPSAFIREYVPGSIRYVGKEGPLPPSFHDGDGNVTGDPDLVLTTYFRPILDMIVRTPINPDFDYDAGNCSWSIELEERAPADA